MIDNGSAGSLFLRRAAASTTLTAAKPTTTTTSRSHPAQVGMLEFSIALTVLLLTEMLPLLTSHNTTPWNARNSASVMTNDGTWTLDRIQPMNHPITTPVTAAARTAVHHDQPCSAISLAITAAQTPAAVP